MPSSSGTLSPRSSDSDSSFESDGSTKEVGQDIGSTNLECGQDIRNIARVGHTNRAFPETLWTEDKSLLCETTTEAASMFREC